MRSPDVMVFIVLTFVNVAIGIGCAIPLARHISRVIQKPTSVYRCFLCVVSVYCIEGVSMVLGMGIPVLSVCLAFAWGIVFGLWLKGRETAREIVRTVFFLSLYTSLPAVSFITIPVISWVEGRNILSVEEAIRFGIPELPTMLWPVCTILGFYAVLAVGAVIFKTIITTGEVSLLIHLGVKEKTSCPKM